MQGQAYEWTCSVCSIAWALQSLGVIDPNFDQYSARYETGLIMGYPGCVNEVYGCMSAQCVINTFGYFGLQAKQAWVNFDQAYAIMRETTGVINPTGMYHFMACRGVVGNDLWVANSAQGYRGIYDYLNRADFNALGPVQMIYLVP
jgi:hypothetical protein